MTSAAKDQTSFSQSPVSKSLWATAQVSTFTANQCPSFERYVATFYHLSPFGVRSAASGRWEEQTKASSVLYSLKIYFLFRRGGKKDRSTGPPISKMETPHETSQHDGSCCLYKTKKKESLSEAAELNLSGATLQFTAHLYNQRLCQCRAEIQS